MLDQAKNIFIVGVKGVAMANLALILKKMGKNVCGSDVDEEFITDELLEKNEIKWLEGFDKKMLPKNTDFVIYSAAHQGINNPQIIEAKRNSIKILSQAELLGQLTRQFKTTIAVCGSHGKTTTSSLLSYALIRLAVKPSYMVGSSSFNDYPGGNFSGTDYFVVEADEYGINPPYNLTPKFHFLKPNYILCTNIDFDHPDIYKNLDEIKKAYKTFFAISLNQYNDIPSRIFLCVDDETLMSVAKKLPRESYLTYGYSKNADLQIVNSKLENKYSTFKLLCHPELISGSVIKKQVLKQVQHDMLSLGLFKISLYGEKNVSNATGVILTLLQLGFNSEKIKLAIKDFTGPKRRFEQLFVKNSTFLFDDYAHHPNEIEATISAARSRFPNKRIIIIFQPHTYSRTQALLKEFGKSLSLADLAYILPIFASARENPRQFSVSSIDIENASSNKNVKAFSSKKELLGLLTSNLKPGDVVFTLGAGDVYKLSNDIMRIIKYL